VYGNPRYIFHFTVISWNYKEAVKLANKIGGSKYRGKSYGGGIVVQSYNLQDTEEHILEVAKLAKNK
jgi:hypothetical protein